MVYFRERMNSPVFNILWLAVSAAITLFLPGAALLAWLPHRRGVLPVTLPPPDDLNPGGDSLSDVDQGHLKAGQLDFPQQLGRALGLSMALTALGGLVTFLTGIRLSATSLSLLYAGVGLVGLVGGLRRWKSWRFSPGAIGGILAALIIGAGLVVWRLYQARDLALPVWVDAVHHALIVRVILTQGGLPGSLIPYMPVPLYYHFGFHVLAAVFTVFSRLPVDRALLVFGQVLEAAMSLAAYRLAFVLFRYQGSPGKISRWPRRESDAGHSDDPRELSPVLCGLAAALLVGLFTHMPGYYLTWGRYTLLAGMILLALIIAEVLELIQTSQSHLTARETGSFSSIIMNGEGEKKWLVLGLLTAGLLLTHYLVAVILALFLGLQAIPYLWSDLRRKKFSVHLWLPFGGGVALGVLLALPWLVWVLIHAWSSFSLKLILPADSGGEGYASYLWILAGPQRNYWLLLVAGLGLLLALLRRGMRVFAVWSLVFVFLCLPVGLRLGPLRPDIMVMMLFLPEVALAAYLLVSAGEAVSRVSRVHWVGTAAAGLALGLLCLWGWRETGQITNPITIIATQPDQLALEWIDQNLPADARFYINTTLWQGNIYRGVDGGWWILPLTGRQTLLPPVIYTWGTPDYIAQINAWAGPASHMTTCTAEFWQVVQSSNVNYIYLREGVGALQPAGLVYCSGVQPVYQVEGVDIYKIQK